jgi:hypothetical protein
MDRRDARDAARRGMAGLGGSKARIKDEREARDLARPGRARPVLARREQGKDQGPARMVRVRVMQPTENGNERQDEHH